jgi:hypothetical protein
MHSSDVEFDWSWRFSMVFKALSEFNIVLTLLAY